MSLFCVLFLHAVMLALIHFSILFPFGFFFWIFFQDDCHCMTEWVTTMMLHKNVIATERRIFLNYSLFGCDGNRVGCVSSSSIMYSDINLFMCNFFIGFYSVNGTLQGYWVKCCWTFKGEICSMRKCRLELRSKWNIGKWIFSHWVSFWIDSYWRWENGTQSRFFGIASNLFE